MLRKQLLLLITLFVSCNLHAQLKKSSSFTISGTIIESTSNLPIDYATVTIFSNNDSLLTGVTTTNGGMFSVSSKTKNIYLKVSFIGYETKIIDSISFNGKVANLGRIKLGSGAVALNEVQITAEKSSTEFKLDKRVFHVGKDLSSTGASTLEVLNNVPSVNVSIEGEISLRGGSGVQILIDGKPSVLANDESNALGTITADMVEKVEVITNPSAKYEAEGTAGIINIVLKKNEKKGLNGSVSFNTGIPDNHSFGLSLNKRTEKFNLFTQLGLGYRSLPSETKAINSNFINNQTVSSVGEEFRNEMFYNLILGTDYYINKNNIITLSGSFAYEVENQPSSTLFNFINSGNEITKEWKRTEITSALNPKIQYELQYKKDFKDNKKHKLQLSAIGNYFGKDQSSVFSEEIILGTNDLTNQTTNTSFEEGKYTFNLDYTKPFNKKITLEAGSQYVDNTVSNNYQVKNEVNNILQIDPDFSNLFKYEQKVLGVYTTGAYEGDIWGLKLGIRTEYTNIITLLVNTDGENNQTFINLFPSVHSSYKLSERISFQVGYSRRIYRPRLWDLNPFFNIRNNFSIRTGNPNLEPEYTDSYEFGSIFILEKTSLNINIYNRKTTNTIERVSIFENNVNTQTPMNIGTNNTFGVELNFKQTLSKKISVNGDANFNFFNRKGSFNNQSFDFDANQWSGKLTSKFKLNKSFDFEVTGNYQSSLKTVQGINSENIFADFGLRYKINKGKMVLNLSVRDVFASRIRENTISNENFFAYSFRQRGRFITLGFSYGFGKGEAMQYSGARRR